MTNQCAHGQLRRQCDVCERDEQIATLTAKLARMREIADWIERHIKAEGIDLAIAKLREVGES